MASKSSTSDTASRSEKGKVMRFKPLIAIVLLLFVVGYGKARMPRDTSSVPVKRQQDSIIQAYGFVHHERTDATEFIIVKGTELTIDFDMEKSDRQAVSSFFALNHNIFLPNANGKNIVLEGYYTAGTHAVKSGTPYQAHWFVLRHWYIKSPFRVWNDADVTAEDMERHKKFRKSLIRADFEAKFGFDPKDANFDPAQYQHPMKAILK